MSSNLASNIQSGSRAAFQEVFDRFFSPLCAFSYKYLQDKSEVEDMIQEVFVRFWEARKAFEDINAIKAFLYSSARNQCLNRLKHLAVVQKHESNLIYELESEQYFSSNLIEEEVFAQLHIEIQQLPIASQRIMLLAMNGLKNAEIADELDISENTVKTQKKIAYAKIRDRMGSVFSAILLSF